MQSTQPSPEAKSHKLPLIIAAQRQSTIGILIHIHPSGLAAHEREKQPDRHRRFRASGLMFCNTVYCNKISSLAKTCYQVLVKQ